MSWLTDTLIMTGALITLVLVLRRPVARLFGPGLAYALWALPLLRLVLPPLMLPEQSAPIETVIALAEADAVLVASAAPPPAVWPLVEVATALWLSGALGFLIWRVVAYRAMRRRLLDGARPVGEAGPIRLVESPAVPAPVAFGLTDKVIALPPGFMAGEDRTARDLAITHELEHHAARDIAVNFAMQPLLALHWFNPLAWLGWRALRRDQEAACDARVLAGRSAETRAAYARLIAGYAQGQKFALAAPLACPVVGEKSIIYRLRSLTMSQPSQSRRRIGRLLIGAAVLALPLTATITYAAGDPAPPVPPAAPASPEAPKVRVEKHVILVKHEDGKDGDHAGHAGGRHKVMIIDNPGGSTIDDSALHTRMVESNGRTIVLKSREPLSEEEAKARVAKAEASLAAAEASIAEKHGGHSVAMFHPKDGERREVRTVMMVPAGGEWAGKHEHGGHAALVCGDGKVNEIHADTDKDGKKQVVKLKICSTGQITGQALHGLRQARDKVATDSSLSTEIKAEVLKELDEEIARLARED